MCSIVASFDRAKLQEMIELNRYRGELAHSITVLDTNLTVLFQVRRAGSLILAEYDKLPEGYIIAHQQAPTDTDPSVGIHPSKVIEEGRESLLWHNGILKSESIAEMRADIGEAAQDVTWDTELLNRWISRGELLDERIDGSFACIRLTSSNLYVFRNEIAPLYIDQNLNISSTKAEGLYPLPPNIMWSLNLPGRTMSGVSPFVTASNPYYFESDDGDQS